MLLYEKSEQFTDAVHSKNTLNVLLTNKLEIESVAIIVMAAVEPAKVGSVELIVMVSPKISQTG